MNSIVRQYQIVGTQPTTHTSAAAADRGKVRRLVGDLLGLCSLLLRLCLFALQGSKCGVCPSQGHRVPALVLDDNFLAEAMPCNSPGDVS